MGGLGGGDRGGVEGSRERKLKILETMAEQTHREILPVSREMVRDGEIEVGRDREQERSMEKKVRGERDTFGQNH